MEFPYKRILITGCGGAGKSTLARRIGERFGLPVVHLDRLWWLPGWVERERPDFDRLLSAELDKPAWVIDGNFSRTFAWRLEHADLCLYLDFDLETCMQGVYDRWKEYDGRTRPDMTEGCPERVDSEFEVWIRDFNVKTRPFMLEKIKQSGVPCKIFTTRAEAYEWLERYEGSSHAF